MLLQNLLPNERLFEIFLKISFLNSEIMPIFYFVELSERKVVPRVLQFQIQFARKTSKKVETPFLLVCPFAKIGLQWSALFLAERASASLKVYLSPDIPNTKH